MHIRWAAPLQSVAVAVGAMCLLVACTGGDDAEDADAAPTTTTTTIVAAETSTTVPPAIAAPDLQRVVADTWTAIWVRDWDTVIDAFDAECQAMLSPADFDATLGLGVEALTAGGVDVTETTVKVEVSDFIEGESARVTSVPFFVGFEDAGQEDVSLWVVEDNEWRRSDCDEVAGAAGRGSDVAAPSDEGDEPSASLGSGPGSATAPAAFGSVFAFEGWRGAIVDVIDAAPFRAATSEPALDGQTHLMVVTELLYTGANFAEPDPFLVRAVGSADYESFDNTCVLDPVLLAAQDIVPVVSAMPGQSSMTAACLAVPTDEIPSLSFVLENVFGIADPEVHYRVGGVDVPSLPAADIPPADPAADARPFGEVAPFGDAFAGTVLSIHDGIADGLVLPSDDALDAGTTHAVVIWEGTHLGSDEEVTDPFIAVGLGSAVFEFQWSPCVLDLGAVQEAHGVDDSVVLLPNQTFRGATCFTMPTAELSTVVVQLDNVFDFDAAPVRFVG